MKLYFKQRFFSWFDSYDIYDEYGNTAYTVKGQLSWGHKLAIFNNVDQEIAMVKEVVLTFLPKFEMYINGNLAGTLKKELTFFKPKYNIDFNGWHVEGNWLGWEYDIQDSNGSMIAHISKELFHMTDHYSIEVYNPQNQLGALMVVLAIDAEKCSQAAATT